MSSSNSSRRVKDDREDDSRQYMTLLRAAKEEMQQGNDNRLIADKCLLAFLAAPAKWDSYRWTLFHTQYAGRLLQLSLENKVMSTDCKQLKAIYKDETELVVFRADAKFTLGLINMHAGENERSAKYFRTALDLIATATSSERSLENHISEEVGGISKTVVGELLDNMALGLKERVEVMENGIFDIVKGIPDDFDVKGRLYTGGGKCDCCGKDRSKVQGGLYRCSRCKLAYYCSPRCQNQKWEDGHWDACRAPSQIEAGDYMMIRGLEKRPDLNFSVARVLGPAPGGRWQVSVHNLTNTLSLLPEKLHHIHPAC